jgi:hypothetical protein
MHERGRTSARKPLLPPPSPRPRPDAPAGSKCTTAARSSASPLSFFFFTRPATRLSDVSTGESRAEIAPRQDPQDRCGAFEISCIEVASATTTGRAHVGAVRDGSAGLKLPNSPAFVVSHVGDLWAGFVAPREQRFARVVDGKLAPEASKNSSPIISALSTLLLASSPSCRVVLDSPLSRRPPPRRYTAAGR